MSEPTTATAAGRPPRAPGATYAGLTRNQWIIVGAVFVVVAGVIIWRRHAASSASSASSGSSGSGSGECTDASGNSVPCDQADLSGELSALQTELETLMAQEGQAGGAGGGTVTVPAGGTGTGTGSSSGTSTGTSTGSGTSTGTTSSTGTTTGAKKVTPTQVSGVRKIKVTATSVTIAWVANPNATSYRIRVTYQGQLVKQQAATGTSATISGLTADHTYGFHVAGVNSAGTGPEGTFDVKTAKK